ncbi:MAG: zf-TFIIB domain-containing protein [Pseudomonadota bacterium]
MNCPVCNNVNLVMTDRQGIEIDYCPQCRGVWLDRGELDKLIDRSIAASPPQRSAPPQPVAYSDQPSQPYDNRYPQHGGHHRKKKREGFLGDLFDFD